MPPQSPPHHRDRHYVNPRLDDAFACALVSGILSAALFNPWDRALYLSVLHERPFLTAANFDKPFQGFWQAIAHRILSGGCWFMLEDLFTAPCHRLLPHRPVAASALIGICAGAINGAILNPVALTKYRLWGKDTPLLQEMYLMLRHGGVRSMFVGGMVTVMRDSLFGVVYTVTKVLGIQWCCRHNVGQNPSGDFVCKMVAGALATTLCSPLNYARNIKYSHHCLRTSPPGIVAIWAELGESFCARVRSQGLKPGLAWLQMRLTSGWGITRVAMGMAFGDWAYSRTKAYLASRRLEQSNPS